MSKLNKLYIAIQIILIWAIVFTIPNSLLLQVVLWINLLYTAYTLSFTDVVNDDLIESELNIKALRQAILNETMRLDTVIDEIEELQKKAPKKAVKKTTKKATTKTVKKEVKKEVKKATAKKAATKKAVKKAVKKK
jgi:histone H1